MATKQQQPKKPHEEADPKLVALADFLLSSKSGLNLHLGTLVSGHNSDRKVQYFRAKRAVTAMTSDAFKKYKNRDACPTIENEKEAEKQLLKMAKALLIYPCKKSPDKKFLVPDNSARDYDSNQHYAFLYEGSPYWTLIKGRCLILGVLLVVLYPVWPESLRAITWYPLSAAFSIFLAFLAIYFFRFPFFALTYFLLKPGIWILPNIDDEKLGFIDSFKPLWDWHQPVTKEKTKSQKPDADSSQAGETGHLKTD
eukprot:NODE_1360_length_892_cov_63.002614_g1314_i0.p1 GENE.NODE_1360_length_892_cov_63.002614_g1314_i0~~NODE_1360_length_892_cov_63.002614_g1314_i0.p1  ORF type:complete len:254 (+),score=35.09 NODE_1360_length_892_cov_63.002614_g1314_i0:67-828(+)